MASNVKITFERKHLIINKILANKFSANRHITGNAITLRSGRCRQQQERRRRSLLVQNEK